ncbi:hypothetical protein [Halomonas denitrificans]|nr:hypothetical protein [Halomonas denitrificans]
MSASRGASSGRKPRGRVVVGVVVGLMALPLVAGGAGDPIYRCKDGDTTVFSDRPCDEAAEVHRPRASLSVIASPESLEQVKQANAAYLESVQAERAARRAASAEQARREARAARYVPPAVRRVAVVPAYPYAASNPPAPGRTRSVGADRMEARRDAPERRLRRATEESRPPLAAGGRQLGARREDDDG